MWILKDSRDLLDNLESRSFSQVSSVRAFDFSTLYAALPHGRLKARLGETVHGAFSHGGCGSKFIVLGCSSTYFSNKIHKGKTCYSEEQVISMLEFLIDNMFVSFGGTLFQQVVGIPMGTNCAPLLADLYLYSYESECLQKLVKDKKIHEARAFIFTYRYIDDVLSINNSRFAEFLPLIYPPELMKMTFQEIRIIATGPCIANQLRDVNNICRRSWYIAAHFWKIYDFKIEVVPLIINFSTELTTVVKFEV
jgi:hypothetical protein